MMRISMLVLGMFMFGEVLLAQDTVVFVHGRSSKNHCSKVDTTDVNNYWSDAKNIKSGEKKVFVGYDGSTDPRSWGKCRAQSSLWGVLYRNCRGQNNCRLVCHSAGCYAIDSFLSSFPTAFDNYKINVSNITAIASASGGSELANLQFWSDSGMVGALKTGTARGFNHNVNGGVPSYHYAGHKGWWYTELILPGEDDGAVSFHSSCGKNATSFKTKRSWWNWSGSSSDWSQCKSQGDQWANHYVPTGVANAGYSSSKQAYSSDHAIGQNHVARKIVDATK